MRFRVLAAIFILLIACVLQFWLASAGVFLDLILAALVVDAFLFSFLELIAFVLFGVFAVNWAPGPSVALATFAAIPLLAYLFRRLFAWTPWAGVPLATAGGLVLFYLASAPGMFRAAPGAVALDLAGSLLFGMCALWAVDRAEK